MTQVVLYKNRYGDNITFYKSNDFEIVMKGGEYMRYGWASEEEAMNGIYNMVDPSGGPYISRGMDMGKFDKKWTGLIIYSITIKPITNEVTLNCYPGKMVKAKVNGEEELRWYPAGHPEGAYEIYNDIEQFIVKQL